MTGKPRLLVVDDDPFVLEMLVIVLEEEGYAVETAGNGGEALETFQRHPGIDLVLTDMNMPGMDGLQLTREIRRRTAGVPVLLLTASDDGESVRRAAGSGVHRSLVKDEGLMDRIAEEVAKALRERQGNP
ncbi:MAG: response regulator [Geobacteraceae bacterium]|nr:response regulator [Geobacteraceae bacterium]